MEKDRILLLVAACAALIVCLTASCVDLSEKTSDGTVAAVHSEGLVFELYRNGTASVTDSDPSIGGTVCIPSSVGFDGTDYPVTSIGPSSFEGSQCTEVLIPGTVSAIGESAFASSSLSKVVLPSSVLVIGDGAFYGCASLESVSIPGTVSLIGAGAFAYCTSVTGIGIDGYSNRYVVSEGMLFDRASMSLMFVDSTVSGDLRIPDVAAVSDYALTGSSVTSVHVPETVRMIGREALSGPDVAFISVDFANRLFSSVDGVLFDHTGKVLIQAPCAMNGGYAVPDPVTDIGESAFKGCGGLVSVTIPGTVDSIGADAFKGTGLTEVVIGDGPIAIDPDAFQGFVFLIDEGADRPLGMDEIPGHRYTGTDGRLVSADGGI